MPPGSTDEWVARDLLSRALDVQVEIHDDRSQESMFDFRFELPDGRLGCAEMTTVTDPRSREWMSQRVGHVPGSRLQWQVEWTGTAPASETVYFKDALEHLRVVVPLLEAQNLRSLRAVGRTSPLSDNGSVKWLRGRGLRIRAFNAKPEHHGLVFPAEAVTGAFPPDSLGPMLDWLEEQLTGSRFDGEFAKIARPDYSERHLVLRLDRTGMPAEHFLAFVDWQVALPSRPPAIPGRVLTGLWLMPEWAPQVIWWMADRGWDRLRLNRPD